MYYTQYFRKFIVPLLGLTPALSPYVPANTLQTIYSALIQPYFDYCSPLWGVCNKTLKDRLQKFQNRAAKIIAGVSLDTRSAEVLRSLGWNELEVRRPTSKSLLIYKILNDFTGPNLKESLVKRNIRQTDYDLRNSQTDLVLPKPKREFLKKSFNYSGAKLWNSLPPNAKLASSVHSFMNIIRVTPD